MKKIQIIAFALLLSTAVACCPCLKSSSVTPVKLVGTEFALIQLNSKTLETKSASPYTLLFGAEGNLSGEMSCNRLIGSYEYDGDKSITLSPKGTTMMACPNDTHTAEWQKTMEGVTHYDIDGSLLMLFKGGDVVAVLRAK